MKEERNWLAPGVFDAPGIYYDGQDSDDELQEKYVAELEEKNACVCEW